jgi:hypothetical protein
MAMLSKALTTCILPTPGLQSSMVPTLDLTLAGQDPAPLTLTLATSHLQRISFPQPTNVAYSSI